jgi:hypothetical protein
VPDCPRLLRWSDRTRNCPSHHGPYRADPVCRIDRSDPRSTPRVFAGWSGPIQRKTGPPPQTPVEATTRASCGYIVSLAAVAPRGSDDSPSKLPLSPTAYDTALSQVHPRLLSSTWRQIPRRVMIACRSRSLASFFSSTELDTFRHIVDGKQIDRIVQICAGNRTECRGPTQETSLETKYGTLSAPRRCADNCALGASASSRPTTAFSEPSRG